MTDWAGIRAGSLVYEDGAVLVLDKPPGISVMGERHDTDLVELAKAAGEELFPAHRIDKATSGLVLFARQLAVHGGLTRQFNKGTVSKTYLVITGSTGLPARGVIELPLSAGRKGRVRVAAPRASILADPAGHWSVRPEDVLDTRTYPSTTTFSTLWADEAHSVLAVRPVTGRRHQIRVHLAWIGHPVLNDPLFERDLPAGARMYLHSWRVAFDAAWRGDRLALEADPGAEFWAPLGGRLGHDVLARV